jgi:signal peptidase I
MKKTLMKILNTIVTVLIVIILIASIFVLVLTFTSDKEGGGVPNFLGKSPISVLTNSMKGDGDLNFNKGDLLICDAVPSAERSKADYKKGDVVTFVFDINNDGYNDYVTHRIHKVNKDGTYLTKGDNNETYDQDRSNATVFSDIRNDDIVAVYHGMKINGLGDFMSYIRTQMGFFLVILLPMIIFFLYTAVRVVLNAMAYSKEKGMLKAQEAIANAGLTEEQKAKAIAEYLASQGAAKNGTNAEVETDNSSENSDTKQAEPAEKSAQESDSKDE